MDKKIRDEVKSLIKLGLPENLAIITACANKGKPELAEEYLEELQEEQQELKSFLNQFAPMIETIKLQEEGTKIIPLKELPSYSTTMNELNSIIKCDDVNNEMTIVENDLGITESLTRQ